VCSLPNFVFLRAYDLKFIIFRSEQTLEKLKKLVPPVCTCLRDGLEEEFEAKYLVPGDLVLLVTGDRVPADIRLVPCVQIAQKF
jgi:Ca2+-transporting ATPase